MKSNNSEEFLATSIEKKGSKTESDKCQKSFLPISFFLNTAYFIIYGVKYLHLMVRNGKCFDIL